MYGLMSKLKVNDNKNFYDQVEMKVNEGMMYP